MVGFLTSQTSRLKTALGEGVRRWDHFWFAPQSPIALCWLRILSGWMLIYTHVIWGLDFDAFFGPTGFQDPLLVRTLQKESAAQSFWWLVPDAMQWPVHLGCIAILVLYTAGFLTRVTSILAAVITISYAHRAPLANFGLDQVNSFLVVYLALAPCGKTWSIDRLWERWRLARSAVRSGRAPVFVAAAPVASARVVTRLLQIQVCVVYLFASLGKLKGEAWWDGNAIWMAIANQEYQSADLTWLCHFPWLINLLTHFTVAWELTFAALVWRPRWRPLVLAAGILMHLGIGAFLGMWTFGLAMILSYLSFAPPEACAAIESAVAKRFLAGTRVITCGPGWIGRQ